MSTLILTQDNVRSVVSMDAAVPAIEKVFMAHGKNETLMPHKIYLSLEQYNGDFRAMPAYYDGAAGVKWVNSHPLNPKKHGLPAVLGMYILSDPQTALPLAVMDATLLTAVRTGAAAAVASKYLARPDARSIGFVGCGVQSRYLLAAHRVLFRDLQVVTSDVNADAAKRFADEVGGRAGSIAEAAACDIVCTATPTRTPIVERQWVKAGAHINAMGADAPGKQELTSSLLNAARVFIDDFEQATESGEVNVPLRSGEFQVDKIIGTLGQVIAGLKPGRIHANDITIFDSTGLAVQDVALARVVYQAAKERGIGQAVEFV